MKDITRVHLAKVAYDIEPEAKKKLQQYISKLETYIADGDVIEDIEIRMTEILLEHSVKQGDVITSKEVADIIEQLGQPVDFIESDVEMQNIVDEPDTAKKRFYRDMDNGIFGGVLSGLSAYFSVNIVALRLIVIVLAFFSFGTAIVAYLVLWLLVPQAKSATQKLEMRGIAPTLDSLKKYSSQDAVSEQNALRGAQIRKGFSILFGIGFAFLALLTLAFTLGISTFGTGDIFGDRLDGEMYLIAFGLMILAGVLLAALFTIVAYSLIQMKFTKRIVIGSVLIVFLGLFAFGSGVAIVGYEEWSREKIIQERVSTNRIAESIDMTKVQEIRIDGSGAQVDYIANASEPKMEFTSLPEHTRPEVLLEEEVLVVKLKEQSDRVEYQPTVKIYGPQLKAAKVSSGYLSYETSTQKSLTVDVAKNGSVEVEGVISELATIQRGESSVSAGDAVVSQINATLGDQDSLTLGNVSSANLTAPAICSDNSESNVNIAGSLNPIMVNNIAYNEDTFTNTCLAINHFNN